MRVLPCSRTNQQFAESGSDDGGDAMGERTGFRVGVREGGRGCHPVVD